MPMLSDRRLLTLLVTLAGPPLSPSPLDAQSRNNPRVLGVEIACGCDDVPDLLNRLNMAHAAIDRYRRETAAIRDEMTRRPVPASGRREGATDTNLEALQNSVLEAQVVVQDPSASTGVRAKTYWWWPCFTTYRLGEASRCIFLPLNAHERVHVRMCLAETASTELIDRVEDEIAAYEAEIAELRRQLRALPAGCKPNTWVGVIQATEVKRLSITLTHKPSNPLALTSRQTTETQIQRFGAIRYRGPGSGASWTSEEVYTEHHESGVRLSCSGGLRTPVPDRTQRNTYHLEGRGRGVSTQVPSVLLSAPRGGTEYTLSLSVPPMFAQMNVAGYNAESGGCADKHVPFTREFSSKVYDESGPFLIEAGKAPEATGLEGTKHFSLMPVAAQLGGPVNVHTIDVTWHLHRID
jgi:hypothetical protein